MRLTTLCQTISEVSSPLLAVGLSDGQTSAPLGLDGTAVGDLVVQLLAAKDVGTGVGDVTLLHAPGGLRAKTLVVFGLGKTDTFGPGAAFSAGVALTKRLAGKARESVAVVLPEAGDLSTTGSALVQGLIVGTRGPDLRKSEPARQPIAELLIVVRPGGKFAADAVADMVRREEVVGEGVNRARDLANTPPSEKAPMRLAEQMREVGTASGLEVEVWDEKRLHEERFGGLLGVSSGSAESPALVILRYRQGPADRPLALVGKGVTFDSGGLSLKPSASMEDMKADMTGAAVVFSTMCAVAKLGLPANLVGYLPLTENMTGGRAMKLGDVLTIRNGKTVEVLNTDAEGRLILADALTLAVESNPARLIDLATLTGACLVALGSKIAGLFSNDEALVEDIRRACERTGERAWRLPMDDDFDDLLKSAVADCKNVGGKWGGAISAAKFLQKFVGKTPWVHLDIAGPSWADNDGPSRDAGATGCFVRTLVELIATTGGQ